MYEFSLCEGIIQQITRYNGNKISNVADIILEFGSLAGVRVIMFLVSCCGKQIS